MQKKTIRDVDLKGKRVLVRVDFNVPVEDGKVTNDFRIRSAVPTIKAILEQEPKAVILMSHLGRPKGEPKAEFSLKPVVPVLSELLGMDVAFAEDCVGEAAEKAVANLPDGGVLVLENTRFHAGERGNDADFAKQLAAHGDIFVNDAFGSAHRAHASTEGVTHYLKAVAGLLMIKELDYLIGELEAPAKPFIAILGGAKVSDKIGVIDNLLGKCDKLLIGGAMANTFFAAQGIAMGDSLVEEDAIDTAKKLLDDAGDKLVLPVDLVVADAFADDANYKTVKASDGVEAGWRALDIGGETVKKFAELLEGAKTVVWNGPMGVFEMETFAQGTVAVARELGTLTERQAATTIIGGGDSAAAVMQAGLYDAMSHISTGGGASLELLEGKVLPGVAALDDK